jgi:hypothetical protein
MCVRSIDFAPFYDFSIGFWKCADSVVYFLLFILFTSKICLCFPELYVFDILGAGSTYIYI